MNKQKKILFIARDTGGCGFFRCEQPAKFLKRMGFADAIHVLQKPTEQELMEADLVIMQNTGSVEAAILMNFMINHKIPFLTEYDDFIQHVSPHNAGGYGAWNPGTLFVHRSMEMSKKAVGMTVSTKQLAREYFPYNNNIFVIPNYLDKEKWDVPITKRNDDKIRIGWAGGNAHADDLKMISKVIQKIVKEYKGKVVFETMGMTANELNGVFPMKATPSESCSSCGFEGTMHHFPGEDIENYPLVLATRGWDIALAPVISNSFGNCKSNLKLMEYSALGIPVVASPIIPYKEASSEGANVIFAETFEEWYNAIKDLIENPDKRSIIARENKEWMEKYWIQNNVEKIYEIYKQVIEMVEQIIGTKDKRK